LTFTMLTFCQLGFVAAARCPDRLVIRDGLSRNDAFVLALIITTLLQLAAIYLPVMNAVLHTTPLKIGELGLCAGGAVVMFIYAEVEKLRTAGQQSRLARWLAR